MGKNHRIKFVGMDVHQKSISIAIADDGPAGEVRLYGKINNTPEAIDKVIRKHLHPIHVPVSKGCPYESQISSGWQVIFCLDVDNSKNPI